MKTIGLVVASLLVALVGFGAERGAVAPFEKKASFRTANALDAATQKAWRARGIEPANPCSDEVFVRRVYLDMIGTLPEPEEVREFLADRRRNRRAALIDRLFLREEFADYQALRWCDVLRVKSEFPIKLWPNAVQAYHRWVRDAIRDNMPVNEFARALLTSSGSNFRVPPVNFLRAVQSREPAGLAQAAALTFMGSRIEKWPEDRREGLAAIFSRVSYKSTSEWKEEVVTTSPAPADTLVAILPDGTPARIASDEDPRRVFADWLLSPENPWFAPCMVNRVWFWLMGRGIVQEPDDFGPGNPPSNPELLSLLARELRESHYDLRHVYRLILNSSTYQQSSIPRSDHPETDAQFARYLVRPLGAEVLVDALCRITGAVPRYMSAIPEPFTFIPDEQRTIALADGSITSPILEMFGRPARDTGLASERNETPTDSQRLHLLNSSTIQRGIDRSPRLARLLRASGGNAEKAIRDIYLLVLSRAPTDEEMAIAKDYARASRAIPKQAAVDLVWALVNTKEFLYRH